MRERPHRHRAAETPASPAGQHERGNARGSPCQTVSWRRHAVHPCPQRGGAQRRRTRLRRPASWRAAAAAAHTALGHPAEAAALTSEQLALVRKAGTAATLGAARLCRDSRPHEAGPALAEAVTLLEATRPGMSWLSRLPAWALTCGGPGGPARHAPRCAAHSTSPSAAGPRRWPTRPGGNCSRPAPGAVGPR
jgi:hypothetical protein